MFCLLIVCPAHAQGTKADYERAAALRGLTQNKVAGERLEAAWSADGGRLWFAAEQAGGVRRFHVVDTERGERALAFDHAAVAEAIHRSLEMEVDADRLPVERFHLNDDGSVILMVRVRGGTRVLTVAGDAITVGDQDAPPPFQLKARPPFGRTRSVGGREETSVLFINQTDAPVRLIWLDEAGRPRPYSTLAPGASHEQHTYAGHAWLAQRETDEAPLAVFVAEDAPHVARIEGPIERTARPERQRRQTGQRSPDGRWEITDRDHNAWLRDTQADESHPLSTDGKAGDAYGGEVYWSPDGRHVVVYQTEAGQEHKVHLVESSPDGQLQPKLHTIDYLKPGDKIAHPRPRLFDVEQRRAVPIDDAQFPEPWGLTHEHWSADGSRFFFIYNQRGHQVLRLISVDVGTGEARVVAEERSETFVDYAHKLFVHHLEAADQLLWMSERDGWNHLYLIDRKSGEGVRQLTSGQWMVRAVDRVDEETRQVWLRVMGVYPQQDPYHIHFARLDLDNGELTLLTEGDGAHRIDFSPGRRFYIDTYSRVDLPPVHELRRSADGALVCELARADASALLETGWRMPQPFVAKGRDGKTDIYGVIYRPTNFDPAKKYPVIEAIYGGPQGQDVPKAFRAFHGPQALAELGFITVQIDGMGTNWRGKAFQDVIWKNLKDAGFPDRIAWIKAAAAVDPSMDITRVGIYGGSAGGQNAMRAVLDHADFYKAASADCGCHDNRMDKIWWNELWMGYPVDESYAASSNVVDAHKLGGALQLMVGELDRNVDPASTMQVADALIKADKDFELIVFPGAGHGAGSSPYGRRRMYDFFVRELLGVQPRAQ